VICWTTCLCISLIMFRFRCGRGLIFFPLTATLLCFGDSLSPYNLVGLTCAVLNFCQMGHPDWRVDCIRCCPASLHADLHHRGPLYFCSSAFVSLSLPSWFSAHVSVLVGAYQLYLPLCQPLPFWLVKFITFLFWSVSALSVRSKSWRQQWLTLLFDLFLSLVCVMAIWINMTVIQLHPGQLSRQLLPHSAYLVSRPWLQLVSTLVRNN
jgi:hypothetical protein